MKKLLFIVLISFCHIFSAQKSPYLTITVAQDGSGQFNSIQEAINSVRDFGPGEALIKIKSGVYKEKIVIPSSKHQITLEGENRANTIITNNDFSGKIDALGEKITTFTSYTLLVRGDDIKLRNLSIKNSSCNEGQAVALNSEGDRFSAENCTISGCQDTLYTSGKNSRQYFKNCLIEGTTDFIFGAATVVFKNCTIKSLANSYITAASTDESKKYGYVFFDCKLIAKEGITKVFLGRPWRPFARTVFMNTEMGKHILPEGWNPWKGDKMFPDKDKTAYYAEYNSKGEGANFSQRVSWSHQLTKKEAKKYTLKSIFGDWNPNK